MSSNILKYLLHFIALVLLQVLILSKITLHGYISPYMYPAFLLLLPFNTPRAMLILIGFVLGVSVDLFENTLGIHAAVGVLFGFLRPYVIAFITPPGGYEQDDEPTIRSLSFGWYIRYIGSQIIIHHLIFFALLFMNFADLGFMLLKVLLSSLVSLFLIILYQYLFFPKRR